MSFDFSAFANNEVNVEELANIKKDIEEKEVKSVNEEVSDTEETEIQETTKAVSKNLTMDEKLDIWINEYKGTPKVVYSSFRIYCTFEDSTEILTIVDKSTNDSYEISGRDKFENIIFESNTRAEKERKILKYLEEVHLVKLKPHVNHEVDQPKDTLDDTEASLDDDNTDVDFVVPEDIA